MLSVGPVRGRKGRVRFVGIGCPGRSV